jgi:hypothetical protein
MIVANRKAKKIVQEALGDIGNIDIKKITIILSPIIAIKGNAEIFLNVFPLWLEYYQYSDLLNNPWKIIVIGAEWEYKNLPYYLVPCQKENIWNRLKQLIESEKIDYSEIPGESSGKNAVSVFFHGHGEENIRGVMSRITHYVNNGILHWQEGNGLTETEESFFKHARTELEKLKKRLQKYEQMFQYLPWEKEITELNHMIKSVELFLKAPTEFTGSFEELKKLIISSFKNISTLMRIHKISETRKKPQRDTMER